MAFRRGRGVLTVDDPDATADRSSPTDQVARNLGAVRYSTSADGGKEYPVTRTAGIDASITEAMTDVFVNVDDVRSMRR